MSWKIKQAACVNIKNPILIEGLPGMGNVGKIAVDFLIDALKAKKIYELSSYDLPHCVFVTEENTVELPSIDIYYKKIKGKDILLLAGDIQPISESSCYEFCNTVLDTFQRGKGKEIITLGGIALPRVPKNPKIYCTGTSKNVMSRYQSELVTTNIHGVVGPIMGVSGLLTGLAGKRNIPAVALLAETYGHPNYLGIRGARNLLKVLSKKLNINIDLSELNQEIDDIEKEMNFKNYNIRKITRLLKKESSSDKEDVSYIG